jgi:putative heme iron utilization protein
MVRCVLTSMCNVNKDSQAVCDVSKDISTRARQVKVVLGSVLEEGGSVRCSSTQEK